MMTHLDITRASEEEASLYRQLLGTYERLYSLARDQDYGLVVREAEKARVVIEHLQHVTSTLEPARSRISDPAGSGQGPMGLWAKSAQSLTDVLRMRERVLDALHEATDETRSALARLGRGREALARYRSPQSSGPRLQSCRT